MERWEGHVAIVTGASSGIGQSAVRHLAAAGMKVAALARRADRLQELENEIAEDGRGLVKAVCCDVTQESEVKAAFKWVDENLGNVSLMVNNAGCGVKQPLIADGDNEELVNMFNTNVLGLISCSREAAIRMKANEGMGHIINVNSTTGHTIITVPGLAPYTATKHGVRVLTQLLRTELAVEKTKIRVTSISPGFTRTEMTADYPAETLSLTPDDVVNCIMFVLSCPSHVNISEITVQPTGENIMN